MKPFFGGEGRAALAELAARRRALLAFDFDGTLAPIVSRPDDARMPLAVVRRLQDLAAGAAVAVVSGRSVADLAPRLGFEPRFVVGNHGLEDPDDPRDLMAQRWVMSLDPLRHELSEHAPELTAAGVTVEDKRHSIALHYRLAAEPQRARGTIDGLLGQVAQGLPVGAGKSAVNVMPAGAPGKGATLCALAARHGFDGGLFVGDDDNDDSVFATLRPPDWITVRVGRDHARSQAAFYIDGPTQLPGMLQTLIDTLGSR